MQTTTTTAVATTAPKIPCKVHPDKVFLSGAAVMRTSKGIVKQSGVRFVLNGHGFDNTKAFRAALKAANPGLSGKAAKEMVALADSNAQLLSRKLTELAVKRQFDAGRTGATLTERKSGTAVIVFKPVRATKAAAAVTQKARIHEMEQTISALKAQLAAAKQPTVDVDALVANAQDALASA